MGTLSQTTFFRLYAILSLLAISSMFSCGNNTPKAMELKKGSCNGIEYYEPKFFEYKDFDPDINSWSVDGDKRDHIEPISEAAIFSITVHTPIDGDAFNLILNDTSSPLNTTFYCQVNPEATEEPTNTHTLPATNTAVASLTPSQTPTKVPPVLPAKTDTPTPRTETTPTITETTTPSLTPTHTQAAPTATLSPPPPPSTSTPTTVPTPTQKLPDLPTPTQKLPESPTPTQKLPDQNGDEGNNFPPTSTSSP